VFYRYDDAFWKSLFAGNSRRSKEENIKELGFELWKERVLECISVDFRHAII
jgi:hypothetical protein